MVKEEAEWMGLYCDGDAGAFERLYVLVAPRLLGYLLSLINERATAEDLLQQTFLKLHKSRSAYIRGADPVPWLYTIAHRTCLDEIRRRKHAKVRLVHAGEVPDEPRAGIDGASETDAPEPALGGGLLAAAMAALAQLPPNQREALVLTKVQGKSVSEAAAITGTTPGAVKLRVHRGYVSLRKLFQVRGAE